MYISKSGLQETTVENIGELRKHNTVLWYISQSHLITKWCVRTSATYSSNPDSKIHGAYMGPTWGRQDQGVPYIGPMNLAIKEGLGQCYAKTFCPRRRNNATISRSYGVTITS